MDEPLFHGEVTNILSDAQEVLSVEVQKSREESGRQFLIELRKDSNDEHMEGSWPTGTLCPANARALAGHLLSAAEIAELREGKPRAGIIGIRKLPTITLCGSQFFIDERLRQIRNVADFNHSFDLDGPEW